MSSKDKLMRRMMSLVGCCLIPAVSFTQIDAEHALFTQVLDEHVVDGAVDYGCYQER